MDYWKKKGIGTKSSSRSTDNEGQIDDHIDDEPGPSWKWQNEAADSVHQQLSLPINNLLSLGVSASLSEDDEFDHAPANRDNVLPDLDASEQIEPGLRNIESAARMGDDGYPLVVDLGVSERQNRLARQRLIDEVIQEQGQAFDQDVLEELERVNMRRVFEDDDHDDRDRDPAGDVPDAAEPSGNRENRQQLAANALNHDGMVLSPRVEAVIADYMVRKYGDPANNPKIQAEDAQQDLASRRRRGYIPDRPVNILPASRSIELPVNNLIAIGRRPTLCSSRSNVNRPARAANAVEMAPLGWQGTKSSLKERISYMFSNDVLADVYFIVGKDDLRQRIPAHKFVLSIGSVVFDAMFNGGLTPQNSRDPLEIELPDVEPSAFLTLLKFLYTDEVKIGPESVMTTLYTAKKYTVPAMETACVDFLKQSLGADNAFMLLTQARLFDEPQLEQLCLELIDNNTVEALSGEGFTEIDLDTLCAVLSRDTLRVREAPLFQALLRWSTEECSRRGLDPVPDVRRTVLGSALQLIRFPLMTIEEFAQTAAQSGLLSDRDIVNLFLYFTVNPKPAIGFNDRPRCAIAWKELVVGRFQRNEVRWGYSGMPDRIKFTVDRKIYVIGFGLYGGITGPHEYACTIQMIHCGTGKVMAQNDSSFVCDGSSNTFRVLFRDPVEITPSVTYIASALLKGPDTHYGTKGLRRIVHQSTAGGTVTFQFTYAAGNNNGTSVEDGQIPEIIFYTKQN